LALLFFLRSNLLLSATSGLRCLLFSFEPYLELFHGPLLLLRLFLCRKFALHFYFEALLLATTCFSLSSQLFLFCLLYPQQELVFLPELLGRFGFNHSLLFLLVVELLSELFDRR